MIKVNTTTAVGDVWPSQNRYPDESCAIDRERWCFRECPMLRIGWLLVVSTNPLVHRQATASVAGGRRERWSLQEEQAFDETIPAIKRPNAPPHDWPAKLWGPPTGEKLALPALDKRQRLKQFQPGAPLKSPSISSHVPANVAHCTLSSVPRAPSNGSGRATKVGRLLSAVLRVCALGD